MKLLILNGPNLNLLGIREPEHYGSRSYEDLKAYITQCCDELGIDCMILQSNHEGVLVDEIQAALGVYDGIVINPAAYTHTSIAILDALRAVRLPAVEVHLTDISNREPFRAVSYPGMACLTTCKGKGFESYREAIAYLNRYISD